MAEKREVRGEFQIESTCESCGSTFLAEARDDVGGQPDEHLVKVLQPDCPACDELGCKPPPCLEMGCGGELRGNGHDDSLSFSCDTCDSEFPYEILRSLLFGRACEHIAKELFSLTPSVTEPYLTRVRELNNLFLRKARELGVIR